ALDVHQRPHDEVAIGRPAGRDGETAVADHGRGDAVPDAARGVRVPGILRVVVRVDVDEAGCDHEAARVDLPRPAGAGVTDLRDPAARDHHVGTPRGPAAAVHHRAAPNHEIATDAT